MFTDIVGYTAMMGSDREKAMVLVRANRKVQQDLVAKHRGELLKEMGDGSMSSFDTALDAVNCAIELQREARENLNIPLRIGIHLGDITIEAGEVYGDGVNVASRLESIAETGSILISESIEQAIRGQSDIETVYLGKNQLKNVQYNVRTYAIQGEGLPKASVKRNHRQLALLLTAGVLLLLAAFLFSKLYTPQQTIVDEWMGQWDFYYYYVNDTTLQYTGTMSCTGVDSLDVVFEVKQPKSTRSRRLKGHLLSVSKSKLTGELTYDFALKGGFLKEYFEIEKDENQILSGKGRCLAFCAEGTDGVAIEWGGQKRASN